MGLLEDDPHAVLQLAKSEPATFHQCNSPLSTKQQRVSLSLHRYINAHMCGGVHFSHEIIIHAMCFICDQYFQLYPYIVTYDVSGAIF